MSATAKMWSARLKRVMKVLKIQLPKIDLEDVVAILLELGKLLVPIAFGLLIVFCVFKVSMLLAKQDELAPPSVLKAASPCAKEALLKMDTKIHQYDVDYAEKQCQQQSELAKQKEALK